MSNLAWLGFAGLLLLTWVTWPTEWTRQRPAPGRHRARPGHTRTRPDTRTRAAVAEQAEAAR